MSNPGLFLECTEFLNREAELLDERRFAEWLALLTPEMTYEVRPAVGGAFYAQENAATLALRVKRGTSGSAWAERPPAQVSRLVTNVRVNDDGAGEPSVLSKLTLYGTDDQPRILLCGDRHDRVRRESVGFRLVSRSVRLIGTFLNAPNLGYFL